MGKLLSSCFQSPGFNSCLDGKLDRRLPSSGHICVSNQNEMKQNKPLTTTGQPYWNKGPQNRAIEPGSAHWATCPQRTSPWGGSSWLPRLQRQPRPSPQRHLSTVPGSLAVVSLSPDGPHDYRHGRGSAETPGPAEQLCRLPVRALSAVSGGPIVPCSKHALRAHCPLQACGRPEGPRRPRVPPTRSSRSSQKHRR